MLTDKDIQDIQIMENNCIIMAQKIAIGELHSNVSLSQLIESMNYETRKRIYKPQFVIHGLE